MKVRYFYAVGTSAELATHKSGLIGRGFLDIERAKNVEAELQTHEEIKDVKFFHIDIETAKKPKETRGITGRIEKEYNGIKTFPAKPKANTIAEVVSEVADEVVNEGTDSEPEVPVVRQRDEKGRFVKTA